MVFFGEWGLGELFEDPGVNFLDQAQLRQALFNFYFLTTLLSIKINIFDELSLSFWRGHFLLKLKA